MSVVRMDKVARDFHVDTLILALIGVLAVTRYAVLGDLTPKLAHAFAVRWNTRWGRGADPADASIECFL